MNYNDKVFRAISNSDNGETSSETIFKYFQEGNILTATYAGGVIAKGNIIGKVDENGNIEMRYQHININGEIQTGKCTSIPEVMPNGKIRLHESWQWTSGDMSSGKSIIEEI
jgi:hypothetical protein